MANATYITPTTTVSTLLTTTIIAESMPVAGDGDARNDVAGQLIRGENNLQPYSTHLWDDV